VMLSLSCSYSREEAPQLHIVYISSDAALADCIGVKTRK
jgi:hypothetical protein